MALLNGQTAEQLASAIMKEALEDKLVEVNGPTFQQLVKLTRYNNRTTIFNRGEKSYTQNADMWIKETLEKLITSRYDQLEKQMDKAQRDAANEYFQLLISRGMDLKKAYAEAFGISQPETKAETKVEAKNEEKAPTAEVLVKK